MLALISFLSCPESYHMGSPSVEFGVWQAMTQRGIDVGELNNIVDIANPAQAIDKCLLENLISWFDLGKSDTQLSCSTS